MNFIVLMVIMISGAFPWKDVCAQPELEALQVYQAHPEDRAALKNYWAALGKLSLGSENVGALLALKLVYQESERELLASGITATELKALRTSLQTVKELESVEFQRKTIEAQLFLAMDKEQLSTESDLNLALENYLALFPQLQAALIELKSIRGSGRVNRWVDPCFIG